MKRFWMCVLLGLAVWTTYGQLSLTGKITNQSDEAMPGANVWLKGTRYVSVSDLDGNYKLLNIPSGKYELNVSFVGYETYSQEIELSRESQLNVQLNEGVLKGEDVIVYATRANDQTPTTFSNVSNKAIEELNLGQDLPILLNFTPSMVTTTDAGNGVGYTGMRIRGSDGTRINVTVNGIPINDSESHGTFWVNMPDFASSVNNIQIQRGVGTSTNGAAAFGASVNLQTDMPAQEAYGLIRSSIGSFSTFRNTVEVNTGLINDHWAFQGRLSKISSDGYIDRAASDLKSYYLSGGYYGKNTTIKALAFAGKEVTYQAWYGTPDVVLGRYDNYEKIFGEKPASKQEALDNIVGWGGEYSTDAQLTNLYNADRKFNYYLYDNEVDNYQQDHYQLHLAQKINDELNVTGALHFTHGEGYYEQYRNDDDLANYGLENVVLNDTTITSTDLIRRRWLDNNFIGGVFSLNYKSGIVSTTFGGGYNNYDGNHFGEVIWAKYASNSNIRYKYYESNGKKDDANVYLKTNVQATERLNFYTDLQLRMISYHTKGIDNDLVYFNVGDDYFFFNPKFGGMYSLTNHSHLYASVAVAHREPVRSDFVDAPGGNAPKPERLKNIEAGWKMNTRFTNLSANFYLMSYTDQLVLTGALNDVGSGIRQNVDKSYRAGIELVGAYQINEQFSVGGNLTLSRNKIAEFTEVLYDYAYEYTDPSYEVKNTYKDSDIAFSPNVIAGGQVEYRPIKGLSFKLLPKYVGQQYLDNTSNDTRVIDAYFTTDGLLSYQWLPKGMKEVNLSLLVNNIFNTMYSSNGYTWGYMYDGFLYQQNNYYPQAGRNLLLSASLKF